jgi:hypothetical protein
MSAFYIKKIDRQLKHVLLFYSMLTTFFLRIRWCVIDLEAYLKDCIQVEILHFKKEDYSNRNFHVLLKHLVFNKKLQNQNFIT